MNKKEAAKYGLTEAESSIKSTTEVAFKQYNELEEDTFAIAQKQKISSAFSSPVQYGGAVVMKSTYDLSFLKKCILTLSQISQHLQHWYAAELLEGLLVADSTGKIYVIKAVLLTGTFSLCQKLSTPYQLLLQAGLETIAVRPNEETISDDISSISDEMISAFLDEQVIADEKTIEYIISNMNSNSTESVACFQQKSLPSYDPLTFYHPQIKDDLDQLNKESILPSYTVTSHGDWSEEISFFSQNLESTLSFDDPNIPTKIYAYFTRRRVFYGRVLLPSELIVKHLILQSPGNYIPFFTAAQANLYPERPQLFSLSNVKTVSAIEAKIERLEARLEKIDSEPAKSLQSMKLKDTLSVALSIYSSMENYYRTTGSVIEESSLKRKKERMMRAREQNDLRFQEAYRMMEANYIDDLMKASDQYSRRGTTVILQNVKIPSMIEECIDAPTELGNHSFIQMMDMFSQVE